MTPNARPAPMVVKISEQRPVAVCREDGRIGQIMAHKGRLGRLGFHTVIHAYLAI